MIKQDKTIYLSGNTVATNFTVTVIQKEKKNFLKIKSIHIGNVVERDRCEF